MINCKNRGQHLIDTSCVKLSTEKVLGPEKPLQVSTEDWKPTGIELKKWKKLRVSSR